MSEVLTTLQSVDEDEGGDGILRAAPAGPAVADRSESSDASVGINASLPTAEVIEETDPNNGVVSPVHITRVPGAGPHHYTMETMRAPAGFTSGIVTTKDRVIVPSYDINGGADTKFQTDPCDIDLKGIITPLEYFNAMTKINEAMSSARAKPVDTVLAATSMLVIPLIPWAIRHRKRKTKRKKILLDQVKIFNETHQGVLPMPPCRFATCRLFCFVRTVTKDDLLMTLIGVRLRWRRKPNSDLVLERIPVEAQPVSTVS